MRHIRQRRRTRRRADRQRPQPPGADMADGGRQRLDDGGQHARQHIGQRGAGAAIGHEGEFDARHLLELHADEVRRRAIAAIGHADRAGPGAGGRQEFLQRARGVRGADRDHHRQRAEQTEMGEIRHRIIGDVGEQRRARPMRGEVRHHDHVRITARLGHQVARQHAARAGAVLHHHRLADPRRKPLRHQAREDVGRARRREGHDPAHRPLRPGALRARGQRGGGQREAAKGTAGEKGRTVHVLDLPATARFWPGAGKICTITATAQPTTPRPVTPPHGNGAALAHRSGSRCPDRRQ